MINLKRGDLMFKRLLAGLLIFATIFIYGCQNKATVVLGKSIYHGNGVSITNKGNYFDVLLDYTSGLTPTEMGKEYAKGILQVVPNYEALVDSYIAENVTSYDYKFVFNRTNDIKPQIYKKYYEEIEGMASVFSGGNISKRGDNKISKDEFLMFNLFTDVIRPSQCCFVSVFGKYSETNKTLTTRNLDWYGGSKNQLPMIQAVITIKYPKEKICSIGYMGYMGILTGFNDSKVFAGILDAGTGAAYNTEARRSYVMDLRYALENNKSLDEVVKYMKDINKLYTFNHIIGLSDPNKSVVLENNFSGQGAEGKRTTRAIRYDNSKLNKRVVWKIDNAIAAVNSFVLYGNNDNHTIHKYNTKRWDNVRKQLSLKGSTVSIKELKQVTSYNHGSPGVFSESGDIYNKMTLQIVVFQPNDLLLEVFFRPKENRVNPNTPVFENISVFQ